MSRQVNFFAHPLDAQRLHARLLQEFPDLGVIRTVVGPPEELAPVPAEDGLPGAENTSSDKILLVPAWARDRVVLKPYTEGWRAAAGQSLVRQRLSPVIEYVPSVWERDRRRARIGRLYWQFEGQLSAEEERQLNRILRWVRSQTAPVPALSPYRIFPETAREAHLLVGWGGKDRANPFRGETTPSAGG